MKIQILIDNKNSWMIPYAEAYCVELEAKGHHINLIHEHRLVTEGEVLVLLSCERKFSRLDLNTNNLVVHESALPEGKGWSPMTWQVLEGRNRIPISLLEASEEIDSGLIYRTSIIQLDGSELVDDLRQKQAEATFSLLSWFINEFPKPVGEPQRGESTFYRRRTPEDSELDAKNSLLSQFNLLRVCDNKRYPAFFILDGVKYIVKISKDENSHSKL